MSETNNLSILYFEDDEQVAAMTMDYLQTKGHRVVHFAQYPASGLNEVRKTLSRTPDVLILDINLPEVDGYELCQIFRQDYLPDSAGIIFTSGLMNDNDIMKAFEVGADDYLVKPVRLAELSIKLQQVHQQRLEFVSKGEQAQAAMQMAFSAMRTSSELGEILRYQEHIHTLPDAAAIAQASFELLQNFELKASIMFFHENPAQFFRWDGLEKSIERETMQASRNKGRMYHWKQLTFLNYEYVSILFHNMPLEDEERYGVIKDQICLIFNGLDTRLISLMMQRRDVDKQAKMKSASSVLAAIALETEQSSRVYSEQFEKIMFDMHTNIKAELAQFNLIESEEMILLNHIDDALNQATSLFDESIEAGRQQKELIERVLTKLQAV